MRQLSLGGLALLIASFVSWPSLGGVSSPAAREDIFRSTNLLRLSIEIPEEGLRTLRSSFRRSEFEKKTKALARVVEGDRRYTNVSVQLKGTGTFRPIDQLPSLTLNFDKFAPKQTFHGLTKISLNNSAQDPTCLHEKISRELFAAAGVPVPRADHAVVTLNGRKLGLYVLVEGYNKQFLRRYFARTDGNLYDGGYHRDIDTPLEFNSGSKPSDRSGLNRLVAATREPDPEKRFRALERTLDMERFLAMLAVETLLSHWDCYSMNRSNYRVYHDPQSDKIVFMPHGMDRVLGGFQPNLDLPVVPPMRALVARAVISTPEGRRRHIERVGALFTNLFQPERLGQRVREIDAKIASEMTHPEQRWPVRMRSPLWDVLTSGSHTQDVEDLCTRINTRAAHLKEQFSQPHEAFAPAPRLEFEPAGVAAISGWKLKHMDALAQATSTTAELAGRDVLRVALPEGAKSASLRRRASLPPGHYRLSGRLKSMATTGRGRGSAPSVMVHYSGSRFGNEIRPPDWADAIYDFIVADGPMLEEVELIFDLRGGPGEVWFEAGSLRLQRQR